MDYFAQQAGVSRDDIGVVTKKSHQCTHCCFMSVKPTIDANKSYNAKLYSKFGARVGLSAPNGLAYRLPKDGRNGFLFFELSVQIGN